MKLITALAFSAILLTSLLIPTANALSIPPMETTWDTTAAKKLSADGVSFTIEREARLRLTLPRIKTVAIDYESDGWFRLDYVTVREGYKPYALITLLRGRSIKPGTGKLFLDFRHTENWGHDSFPALLMEGNGIFKITNLEVETFEAGDKIAREKDRAFFWLPERYTPFSVNFIAHTFWSFEKRILFAYFLGWSFIVVTAVIVVLTRKRGMAALKKRLPLLSIIFISIFSIHYTIRLLPALNGGLFLSTDEKLERYYNSPELGQAVVAARHALRPDDKVLVMANRNDWFSPEALCFNIAPIQCAYFLNDNGSYAGISDITLMKPEELDTIIYFNGWEEPPFDYEKVWELNKNVFIGRKR